MEDQNSAVVFDISSDEEVEYGGGEGGGGGGGDDVDFKWIRKLLDDDDDDDGGGGGGSGGDGDDEKVGGFSGGGESDESDDLVVVVDEVCGNRKESVKKALGGGESDDEDCVVLDGDPDKPRGVEKEKEKKEKGGFEDGSGDDSDDLVVLSEKGEVACRDFPHPRHLCAKFLFSSSRHEMHCDQCHCYVCDSLAPCVYWGTGVSDVDHCHANDKQAFWNSQRSSFRSVELPKPMPVPAVNHIGISMRGPPMTDRSSPLVPNPVQQNQVLKQFTVRPCSTPTNRVVPNITRQGPRPAYAVPRSRCQTISQNLADTSPHVLVTDRGHNNLNMGLQRAQSKRTAEVAFSSGRGGINPPRLNYGSRLPTDPPPARRWQGSSHGRMTPLTNAYQRPYLSNVGESADMLSPQTDPFLGNRYSNTMPPQMLSRQNSGTGIGNGILLKPQMAAQQHMTPGYTNYYVPPTSSRCPVDDPLHPLVGNIMDLFVSGPNTTHQLDMGYGFMNTVPASRQLTGFTKQNEGRAIGYPEPTQSHSFSQFEADTEYLPFPLPNAESSSIDQFIPYESLEYNQPTVIPNRHDNLHLGGQRIFETLSSNVVVSDSRPVSCPTPSTQLSGGNSRLQNAEQTDYYSENTNSHPQVPNPTDFVTKDLEAWLSVDHSIPDTLGISPPLLHTPIPSPELASLDGSGLFID